MTQEHKELLMKDLCSRVYQGVKVNVKTWSNLGQKYLYEGIFDVKSVFPSLNEVYIQSKSTSLSVAVGNYNIIIKPYLFPLSSMTDEQIMQSPNSIHVCDLENLRYDSELTELNSRFTDLIDLIDWLNTNHFDYRGLIEKGLAIDATGLNIY